MPTNLTTRTRLKRYFAITPATQDAVIDELIPRASAQIIKFCSREFPAVTRVNKRLNGSGSARLVLPDQPILSVQSLSVDGKTIAASSDGIKAPGYVADDTSIVLIGGMFTLSRLNVVASWTAGYEGAETWFVPTGNTPVVVPADFGLAAAITSVTRVSTGEKMVEVGASPVTGQYAFDRSSGSLTFATADSGQQVTIVYQYVPADVEQACIEMVGLDMKQRDNIGVQSKSMAGESVTYADKGLTTSVKEALKSYRRLTPG